ncbi:hypothetical protein PHET_07401 [Paragonimus heterotremus]|uniref:PPM-type phosphatase domain-containing protein n=1 Tax=Paragonimus heterotremus TaxID=100268 RepID=A0A8J4THY6_9TREM|nr:hypothetical protein PHET_07401 [Paragonimus heterotremus]
MDPVNFARFLAGKFDFSDKKTSSDKPTIRLRPVLRLVLRKHVIPYVLSIADKHAFTTTGESISFICLLSSVWNHLCEVLKAEKKDSFDYNTVHSLSLDCLRKAVELCLSSDSVLKLSAAFTPWTSLGVSVDASSIMNRRRRQEDRWFATADLFNYVLGVTQNGSKIPAVDSIKAAPVFAVGVFDGHNGPEAAEHCSHLAPYLLSLGLKRQAGKDAVPLTDLLAYVFYELNLSLNEGKREGLWSSGTTATVCAFQGDRIYTAWVGDSQAWLVYMPADDVSNLPKNSQPTSNNTATGRNPNSVSHLQSVSTKKSPPPKSPRASRRELCPLQRQHTSCNEHDVTGGGNSGSGVEARGTSGVVFDKASTTGQAVALTDSIHRPEFAPEFISVIRNGGAVSLEVAADDHSSPNSPAMQNVFRNFQKSLTPTVDAKSFEVPQLSNPNLVDCRVGGLLCVSRALGDDHTVAGMSSLPSVTVWKPGKPPCRQPMCLVVASDGLWDTDNCSESDVAACAQKWFRKYRTSDGHVENGLARELTQMAVDNGASDNVTCVVVWLNRWAANWQDAETSIDVPCCNKNVRWPRGNRTTSLVDFASPCQLKVRGPNQGLPLGGVRSDDSLDQRNSMFSGDVFHSRARCSSPPRYKSSSPSPPLVNK